MSWSQACLLMPYSDDVDLRRSCAHLDLPYMCLSILALVSSWIRYYAACSRCCLLLQLYKNFEVCTACKLQRDIADEVCLVRNTTTSCIVVHILSHRCRTSPLHCRRFSSPSASCVIDPVCSTQLASDARNLHYACRPCTTRLHMCYDVPPTLHLPPRGLGRRHSRRTYHRGLGRRHQQSRTSPPPAAGGGPVVGGGPRARRLSPHSCGRLHARRTQPFKVANVGAIHAEARSTRYWSRHIHLAPAALSSQRAQQLVPRDMAASELTVRIHLYAPRFSLTLR
jgi:hypothetical protein